VVWKGGGGRERFDVGRGGERSDEDYRRPKLSLEERIERGRLVFLEMPAMELARDGGAEQGAGSE